jgi:hypothetical protein
MSGSEKITTDAAERMSRRVAERMDKELRGAWRAGYDYLHVYDALDCNGLRSDSFTIKQYILPSNVEQPPRPDFAAYQHTYILDDDVMREAIARIPADCSE